VGSAAAAALAVSVGVKAVGAASALGEQINKTSVVFGKNSKALQAWATSTATNIGISNQAALEAMGTFGNMLVPMGFARKDAAKMSKRFVTLAADMASFNDAEPSEVLDALRAGLAGETEPLRRFGVFLADARLKQEALNMGIYKGKGPLDALAKAQATYAVILKDTKDAQGDYNRTAGSWPNLLRAIRAQVEDLKAALGKGLLPVVQRAGAQLKGMLADPALKERVRELGQVIGQKLLATIRAIGKWFRENWEGIKGAFRTGSEVAQQMAAAARKIHEWFQKIASVTPGGEGTLMALIVGGVLAGKLAGAAASAGILNKKLLIMGIRLAPIVAGILAYQKFKEHGLFGRTPGKKDPGWKAKIPGFGWAWGEVEDEPPAKPGASAPRRHKPRRIRGPGGYAGGPGRALGGPVMPGVSYRVGERGPETFVPNVGGNIVAGGGGVLVTGDITLQLDKRTVAVVTLKELQRMAKSTTSARRGRYGGTVFGV
jgi:hypothetical protein